jgi:hypothetical protein
MFEFRAVNPDYGVKAGVSTKPLDGTLIELQRRSSVRPNHRPRPQR